MECFDVPSHSGEFTQPAQILRAALEMQTWRLSTPT
jgi:hypothetical protein